MGLGKNIKIFNIYIFMILIIFFAVSCDSEPDRNNPADPGSPYFTNLGYLKLSVSDRQDAYIENPLVFIENSSVSPLSPEENIKYLAFPPGSYNLIIDHPEYFSKSYNVAIELHDTTDLRAVLNGTPVIDTLWINTVAFQGAEDDGRFQYRYEAFIGVSDPDGLSDIETIKLYEHGESEPVTEAFVQVGSSPQYQLSKNFSYDQEAFAALFNKTMRVIVLDEAPDSTEGFVSVNTMFLYEYLGHTMAVPPDDYPPANPTFKWRNPLFDAWSEIFRPQDFKFELFLASDPDVLFDTLMHFEDTEVDTFQYTYTQSVLQESVQYHWRLTLFDPFGNSVITKKVLFVPQ